MRTYLEFYTRAGNREIFATCGPQNTTQMRIIAQGLFPPSRFLMIFCGVEPEFLTDRIGHAQDNTYLPTRGLLIHICRKIPGNVALRQYD